MRWLCRLFSPHFPPCVRQLAHSAALYVLRLPDCREMLRRLSIMETITTFSLLPMASRVLLRQWGGGEWGGQKQKPKNIQMQHVLPGDVNTPSAWHARRRWWHVHPLSNWTLTSGGWGRGGCRVRGPPPVLQADGNAWHAPPINHGDAVIFLAPMRIFEQQTQFCTAHAPKLAAIARKAQSSWLTFSGVAHQSESDRLSHWVGFPKREIQTSMTG